MCQNLIGVMAPWHYGTEVLPVCYNPCNIINLCNICLLKLIILFNQDKQHYLDKAAKRKAKHEKLTKKKVLCLSQI